MTTWNGLEVVKMLEALKGAADRSPGDIVMILGSCAVDLVVARGVDMEAFTRDMNTLHSALSTTDMCTPARERIDAAFATQGAQLAVSQADLERVALERDTLKGELESATRQMKALKAAGTVLSAHADKTAGEPVLDRSTAADAIAVPDADRFTFDEGAEAMRAACWEALSRVCDLEGISVHMREHFKAAIEGATP